MQSGRERGDRGGRRGARATALLATVLVIAAACSREPSGMDAPDPSAGVPEEATSAVPAEGSTAAEGETGRVEEVIDGDTLDVRLADGTVERVRLIGINAPEAGECFSDEATSALATMVAGEEVQLVADVTDRDQYERLLRYVQHDGVAVNAALVQDGFARSRSYPPDTAEQVHLDRAEAEARASGAGLWAEDACGEATGLGGEVVITEVVADPPGSDEANPNAEQVTIENRSTALVELAGWVLKDTSSSHRFTFPAGFVLEPGASVVVHTGCGPDTAADLHWCNQGSLVWNNDGDTAYLEDPAGNTVSTFDA